jgi:predicted anti-sigma-YlaC factor YlaD
MFTQPYIPSTCLKVLRHIGNELDTHLASKAFHIIRKHIRKCPNCAAYLDSLKKLINLYRRQPVHLPTKRLHHHLWVVLDGEMHKQPK